MASFGRGVPTPKSGRKSKGGGAAPKEQQNFSFPNLPVRDILQCIEELDFPQALSADILENCDKNVPTVRRIFEHMLEKLAGLRRDEMHMPVFEAHQQMSWPQLHEDSVPELAFLRATQKLMNTCGITDFSRNDIEKPIAKRLRRQLSGLINFAKFREEGMDLYERITVERDDGLDRLHNIREENKELGGQLGQLRVANTEKREEIEKLDKECDEAQVRFNEKNEEQATIRIASGNLKKLNAELKEQLGQQNLEHADAMEEVKRLTGQVVQSPERVRREMHESQRALQQERRDGEKQEEAAQVSATALQAVEDGVSKVNDGVAALQEILDESNRCIDSAQQIKASELAIEKNRKEVGQVEESAKELQRQNNRLEERLADFERTAESKKAEAAAQYEETQRRVLELRRRRATADSAVTEEDLAAAEIEQATAEAEACHTARMLELLSKYQGLKAEAEQQQRRALLAMNQSPATVVQPVVTEVTEVTPPAPEAALPVATEKENSANQLPLPPTPAEVLSKQQQPVSARAAIEAEAREYLAASASKQRGGSARKTPLGVAAGLTPPTPATAAASASATGSNAPSSAVSVAAPLTGEAPLSTGSMRVTRSAARRSRG